MQFTIFTLGLAAFSAVSALPAAQPEVSASARRCPTYSQLNLTSLTARRTLLRNHLQNHLQRRSHPGVPLLLR